MMSGDTEQMTLKEIILSAQKWLTFFLAKWKFIVMIGLTGGGVGLLVAFISEPKYTSELTLALEEKDPTGGYAGIASQFGLNIGGGGGGAFTGENNIEVLKSRYVIEKALLTTVVIDGQTDLLVNRYIKFNKLDEKWGKEPELQDVVFKMNEPRSDFSIKKDSLLWMICKSIQKKSLEVTKVDKKLSIIRVNVTSKDEIFAKLFTEVLVSTATDFYVETKTKLSRQNLNVLENRLDSVKRALDRELLGAAQSKDQSLNTIRAQGSIRIAQKQLNVQVLTAMYGELVKNTELAKYTLMREEPLIQVIDRPILPLEQDKIGKLMGLIVGGFLGGFLSMLFFAAKEMWSHIMNEESVL